MPHEQSGPGEGTNWVVYLQVSRICEAENIDPTARAVWLTIARYTHVRTGVAIASIPLIVTKTGYARRTALYAIERLEAMGHLVVFRDEKQGEKTEANRYVSPGVKQASSRVRRGRKGNPEWAEELGVQEMHPNRVATRDRYEDEEEKRLLPNRDTNEVPMNRDARDAPLDETLDHLRNATSTYANMNPVIRERLLEAREHERRALGPGTR